MKKHTLFTLSFCLTALALPAKAATVIASLESSDRIIGAAGTTGFSALPEPSEVSASG